MITYKPNTKNSHLILPCLFYRSRVHDLFHSLTSSSIIRQGPAQRAAGHASSRVRGWLPRVRRHSTVPNHEDNTLEIIPAEERIHKFFRHGLDELYPRTERSDNAVTVYKFRTLNYVLKEGDSKEDEEYMVRGMLPSYVTFTLLLANTDVQGE